MATPLPKITSAKPETIWLARMVTLRKACTNASSAAAPIPPNIPAVTLEVAWATRNADTAPINIIPSTPRLTTPTRSVSSSPSPASTSGVPAATAAARVTTSTPSFMAGWPRRTSL